MPPQSTRKEKGLPPDVVLDPNRCPGEPLIEMSGIVKTFKTPAGDFTALDGITACFYPGEFVSVVGKSGSGKSTLVNMITGIDHPTSGTVRIGDTYVHKMDESEMSVWRGRNLGVVFQFFQLLPMLSVLENVVLPMDFCDMYPVSEREERAMALLKLVGLDSCAHKMPAAISGGQQQSAAIARALANDPPIIIADEPTGNLDSHTAESVFEIFNDLVRRGKTILMVTHDISLARRTNRMLLISDGELINTWVFHAFPLLPPSRLLWLSHQLVSRRFEPGEAVNLPGEDGSALLLVTGGHLEVLLSGRDNGRSPGESLEPGQALTLFDLRAASGGISALRAASEAPLETLTLEGNVFDQWMLDAPADQEILQKAAQEKTVGWNHDAQHFSKKERP
jgi:putative ABC transport system ATP-binding protein